MSKSGNAGGRDRVLASAVVAVLLAILARYAYFRTFTGFGMNDDEGYVLQTIRSYLSGAPLYTAVASTFGPGFYDLAWTVHGLLRVPLTHDSARLVAMGWWLIGTALGATIVFRLTRSTVMTAFSVIVVFVHLKTIANEPGHPEGVLAAVVLLVCAIACNSNAQTAARRAAVCGALTAFAALVKINVGGYLCVAMLLSYLLASPVPAVVRAIAVFTAAAVPFIILRPYLASFGSSYAVVVATAVVTVSATGQRERRAALSDLVPLGAYCASGLLTTVLIVLPVIARGTTVSGLIRGVLIDPMHLGSVFVVPLILPSSSWIVALGSTAACLVFAIGERIGASATLRRIAAVAKLAAIWVLLTDQFYEHFVVFLTPFLWLAVAAPMRNEDLPPGALLARTTIALVASLETLQAYPVAGSQMAFATDLAVILAIVAIDDSLVFLSRKAPVPGRIALRFAVAATVLWFGQPTFGFAATRARYLAGYELRLPGASRVRVHPWQVATYQWLTATSAASCGRLLTLPGLYSFNAWSGVPPPTHHNVSAWQALLPAAERSEIWSALDAATDPCLIVHPQLAKNWGGSLERPDASAHIAGRQLVAESEGYRLLMRPGRDVTLELVRGRQSFSLGRSPLPVTLELLRPGPEFTLRAWFRTKQPGVVLSCQSGEALRAPSPTVPIVYVGTDGMLRSAELRDHAAGPRVADGEWHSMALVHEEDKRQLYVDGERVAVTIDPHQDDRWLLTCQAGNGYMQGWPAAENGWMPFIGEIAAVGVTRHAWTETQIADDRHRTHID